MEEERGGRGGEGRGKERNSFEAAFKKNVCFQIESNDWIAPYLSKTRSGANDIDNRASRCQTINIPHPSFHGTQCTYNNN